MDRKFDIMSCSVCGHKFIYPFPSGPNEIDGYYARSYYAHVPHNKLLSPKQKLKEMLRGEYYRRQFNNMKGSLFGKIVYTFLSKTINEPPGIYNGRLLDVGCGNGDYIETIAQYGWAVSGLEPNEQAVKCCIENGLDVKMGSAEKILWPDATFDVVRLWNVLEHTFSPHVVLNEIRRVLKDKGFLLIHVPNYYSADCDQFKQYWPNLEVPRHLHHFTHETLLKYLDKADFLLVRDCYPGMLMSNLRATKDLFKAANISAYLFWSKALAVVFQKSIYRIALGSYKKDVGITILAQVRK